MRLTVGGMLAGLLLVVGGCSEDGRAAPNDSGAGRDAGATADAASSRPDGGTTDPNGGTTDACASGGCDGGTGEAETCSPGAERDCYEGPDGTEDEGACSPGTQTCGDDGQWGECEDQTLPIPEVCGNARDDDCDGERDEGLRCAERCTKLDGAFICNTPGRYTLSFSEDVTEVDVQAWGGGGAGGSHGDGTGGGGGYAGATVPVEQGERLRVLVAEGGEAAGGGGGASYVLRDDGLVLLAAAGGGGGASDGCGGCRDGGAGGAGGGATGQAGTGASHPQGFGMATGGEGATQSSGGAGGTASGGSLGSTCVADGTAGSAHTGGAGGAGTDCEPDQFTAAPSWNEAPGQNQIANGNGGGGSGGAGWFGGGGGGGRHTYLGGGGGGGVSYVHPMTTHTELAGGDRRRPAKTSVEDYVLGAAEGGEREKDGEPGLVVIEW